MKYQSSSLISLMGIILLTCGACGSPGTAAVSSQTQTLTQIETPLQIDSIADAIAIATNWADQGGRVGEQIILSYGTPPATFPANTPFHIAHGWHLEINTLGIDLFTFTLEVDGVLLQEDHIERSITDGSPDILNLGWVFNFPDGMIGTHTFTFHHIGPCQPKVDFGYFPGPCPDPLQLIVPSRSVTIDFIP